LQGSCGVGECIRRKERESVNKTELIEEIAQRTNSSKGEGQRYMESFEEVVAEALRGGKEIQVTGFGRFYVREQKAREGINPQTKEKIHIPASKVPAFSAGKGLKETV
jgi:DNA-binding protein HU-beta